MNYGTSVYATTEPVGESPVYHGKGRTCKKCSRPVNGYAKEIDGFLVCESCKASRLRLAMTMEEFMGRRKRSGRGIYERRNTVLPNLKATRLAKGLSQNELGERAGTYGELVSAVERGKKPCSEATAERLADALGVSVEELTGERLEGVA